VKFCEIPEAPLAVEVGEILRVLLNQNWISLEIGHRSKCNDQETLPREIKTGGDITSQFFEVNRQSLFVPSFVPLFGGQIF